MIKNFKWLLLVSLTFVACNSDETDISGIEPEVPATAGTADFSKYVALGNSLTAGFSDGALFAAGQNNAYPKLLAEQFALVGGGEFKIPYMNDNLGGMLLGGMPILGNRLVVLGFNPDGTPNIGSLPGTPTTDVTTHLTGPFNNMGVPGAKSFHLLAPGYGNIAGLLSGQSNPYFVRFASSATARIIDDAMAQNPTFFSLWIGNVDVLSYATSGGTGIDQTGNLNPATYGSNDITDPTVFGQTYSGLLDALTGNGAKGVVANIPYVNTVPFFTTVPYNPLTSSLIGGGNVAVGDATIDQLNASLYGPLKQALSAFGAGDRINLLSKTKGNPLLIKDETLSDLTAELTAAFTPTLGPTNAAFYGLVFGQARQATSADLVLLSTKSAIGAAPTAADSGLGIAPPFPLNKFGVTYPLQDKHILIPFESNKIKVATDAYNVSIKSLSEAKGLAFVDVNGLMVKLSVGGVIFDDFHMTSDFLKGGAFSLDGIHITARGNAYIANKFIEAINATYKATIPLKKAKDYQASYPPML
ncbi:G-D-S-L family lipolytic protein [Flavobacterium silvisoli]|uniref:G-D-S-L family lipolytic protein n=1 Tax=Flavobacterium silvisoli TaxID=2529433 RepID=A0A4Q9Z2V9_9FLAO|nr:G-D-S-L family lipolytic protein [Flavobacterium silvisoli]TBX70732.1 G-D-S-L family lipolytic protein [Flavobacterium silvisoli]